jgi:hypothetical protein
MVCDFGIRKMCLLNYLTWVSIEYVQGEYAYRLNEGKALHWLRLKVQAIADNIERMPVLLQFITEQLFDINAPQTDTIIRSGKQQEENGRT